MKKYIFLLFLIGAGFHSHAIDALMFPNLVLYKELGSHGFFETAYTGEMLKLKTEITKAFKDQDDKNINPVSESGVLVWKSARFPIVSPESYSIKLENVINSKIIRISVESDSMHLDIPFLYKNIRRKLADQFQLIIDKSLGTEYEELSEKFDTPYLNGGLPNEAALSAHLYFYTTQNTDSVIHKMIKSFQSISENGSSVTRVSSSLWYLDSLVMPELAMDKVFSIVFKVYDLSQGSYKVELFAAYYDPKDWQREEQFNYTVRYYDLHYRLRWFLMPILF